MAVSLSPKYCSLHIELHLYTLLGIGLREPYLPLGAAASILAVAKTLIERFIGYH
jgi:hypothetical protein